MPAAFNRADSRLHERRSEHFEARPIRAECFVTLSGKPAISIVCYTAFSCTWRTRTSAPWLVFALDCIRYTPAASTSKRAMTIWQSSTEKRDSGGKLWQIQSVCLTSSLGDLHPSFGHADLAKRQPLTEPIRLQNAGLAKQASKARLQREPIAVLHVG
jgi:hypothetical protein